MKRFTRSWIGVALVGLALAMPPTSEGQGVARPTSPAVRTDPGGPGTAGTSTSANLLRALQAHPATAAYSFSTEVRGRQVLLGGRVGTKLVHDVAIQIAIGLGVPVVDNLVIDTAAAHQVAAMTGYGAGPGSGFNAISGSGMGGALPYTYPPPIFGRLDDPFFGFEPPVSSFPPWWNSMSAYRLGTQANATSPAQPVNDPATQAQAAPGTNAADPTNPGADSAIPEGTIDMVIDGRGTATLRGVVPTLTDRIGIGQQVAKTPGVTQVVNLISVRTPTPALAKGPSDTPPPPPTPYEAPAAPPRANPPGVLEGPPIVVDSDPATSRINRTIAANPALAGAARTIKVKVRDGVAALSGSVPSVYEAMLAYRSAQQTPGVREVEDRLEFVVPDGSGRNPLAEKGRPEDVEPYLEAQIRRQVGGLAHIDRVRVSGESVELRGTLERAGDRPRFDAILRSMPILRGLRVEATMLEVAP